MAAGGENKRPTTLKWQQTAETARFTSLIPAHRDLKRAQHVIKRKYFDNTIMLKCLPANVTIKRARVVTIPSGGIAVVRDFTVNMPSLWLLSGCILMQTAERVHTTDPSCQLYFCFLMS